MTSLSLLIDFVEGLRRRLVGENVITVRGGEEGAVHAKVLDKDQIVAEPGDLVGTGALSPAAM